MQTAQREFTSNNASNDWPQWLIDLRAEAQKKGRAVVTPELAAKLLERNTKNRPLKEYYVQQLASSIAAGRFEYNGEAVVISETGILLDGQHRLSAFVEAGEPIEASFSWDVPDKNFDTIDTGRSRTGGDVLGIHSIPYPDITSTAARLVMVNEILSVNPQASAGTRLENYQVVEFVQEHMDIIASAEFTDQLRKDIRKVCGIGMFAGLHYLAVLRGHDRETVIDPFFVGLAQGEGLTREDAVYKLRERYLEARAGRNRLVQEDAIVFAIQAFNAYLRSEELKVFRRPIERQKRRSYPTIIAKNHLHLDD